MLCETSRRRRRRRLVHVGRFDHFNGPRVKRPLAELPTQIFGFIVSLPVRKRSTVYVFHKLFRDLPRFFGSPLSCTPLTRRYVTSSCGFFLIFCSCPIVNYTVLYTTTTTTTTLKIRSAPTNRSYISFTKMCSFFIIFFFPPLGKRSFGSTKNAPIRSRRSA